MNMYITLKLVSFGACNVNDLTFLNWDLFPVLLHFHFCCPCTKDAFIVKLSTVVTYSIFLCSLGLCNFPVVHEHVCDCMVLTDLLILKRATFAN